MNSMRQRNLCQNQKQNSNIPFRCGLHKDWSGDNLTSVKHSKYHMPLVPAILCVIHPHCYIIYTSSFINKLSTLVSNLNT